MADPTTRPNGKVYKPRKPPALEFYADRYDYDSDKPFVVRTHDLEVARALLGDAWDEYGVDPNAPSQQWWRLAMRDGNSMWVDDPEHGIPVVTWEDAR